MLVNTRMILVFSAREVFGSLVFRVRLRSARYFDSLAL